MTADNLIARRSGRDFPRFSILRHAVAQLPLAVALLAGASPALAHHTAAAAKVAATAATPADAIDLALTQGEMDKAFALGEAAVAKAPRDSAARVVLGRVYLRAGRFESAAAMLADARQLGDISGRTALGLALAEIACGRGADAVPVLDSARDTIPVGDYGLALAMAGDGARGVSVLAAAVNSGGATPKLRQNLAYAYALDGRWGDARLMASFDLEGDKLDARLTQWTETARPDAARKRVAALISVPLREDPGVPVSLLLANAVPDAPPAADLAAPAAVASAVAVAAPSPMAAPVSTPVSAPALAPALADATPKTDASGQLPPIDHPRAIALAEAGAAAVPAEAAVPERSLPATTPAPAPTVLHRADTTQLVGVASSREDVAAARRALHQRRHEQLVAAILARAYPGAAPTPQPAAGRVPEAAPQALAVATPQPEPIAPTAASQPPVALAEAQTPAAVPAPVQASVPAPAVALAPAHTHSHAHSHALAAALAQAAAPVQTHAPRVHQHKPVEFAEASAPAEVGGSATHLVQLGSFVSEQNAERARQTFLTRDPKLSRHQFLITQAVVNGRNFWRVAVMGFDAGSANHTCGDIRHHGGACFAYAAGHLGGGQVLAMATPHAGNTPGTAHTLRR
jgi:tetratricopeptide (TPR) repeat protein